MSRKENMTSPDVSQTPKRKSRISKYKKKSWGKTDVKDVEEYLDDIRLQERTGGLVAEKTNEQLFFVDAEKKATLRKKKRKRGEPRPLRCHAHLELDSSIKPITKKRPYSIKASKRTKRTAVKNASNTSQAAEGKANAFDLWNRDETLVGDDFYFEQTKKKRVQPPRHYTKKPSTVPAVELPHPGSSYNPTYEDHQGLLQKAYDVEIQLEKAEMKVKRALDDKFPAASDAPTEATWLKEMSAGLQQEQSEKESDEEEDSEFDDFSINPPVSAQNKKTEKQKRKQKTHQLMLNKQKEAKIERIRKSQIFRLKSIKAEVNTRIQSLDEKKKLKQIKKEAMAGKTKRLGKLKYAEPSIEIKLSTELKGSLRQLEPEGHLLQDRYKSLQKRNIIEPRSRVKKTKKYKTTYYTVKSHKDTKPNARPHKNMRT